MGPENVLQCATESFSNRQVIMAKNAALQNVGVHYSEYAAVCVGIGSGNRRRNLQDYC
jgi:hypothetical protein